MTFSELVHARRSIRQYRPDPVPPELVEQVLEAGRWAPSACNSQPWEFIVVTDPQVREAIYQLANVVGLKWPHLRTAPVTVVVCARKLTPYSRDDCIFAGQNMLLAAQDLGLGACWIGGFNERKMKQLLRVPEGYLLPGMFTLGYPAATPNPTPRRELTTMVHADTYQGQGLDLAQARFIGGLLLKLLRLQFRKPRPAAPEQEGSDSCPR